MKRVLAMTIVIGLIGGTTAVAEAGKRPRKPKKISREAQSSYDSPAIGHPDVIVGCSGSTGCATFAIGEKERFITLEITDASGLPVYGSAGQDLDGDNFADNSFTFCGSTPEPVAVEPGYELNIFISAAGGMNPPCSGAATSGTVNAVISNLP